MPNHFHGILIIGENEFNSRGAAAGNKFGPQIKNVASIIRGFKSAVTVWARMNKVPFNWQERFHDHIVRDNDEYERISYYHRP